MFPLKFNLTQEQNLTSKLNNKATGYQTKPQNNKVAHSAGCSPLPLLAGLPGDHADPLVLRISLPGLLQFSIRCGSVGDISYISPP